MEKKILSAFLEAHLSGLSHDGMDIFLLEQGTVRGAILHGSRLVNELRANHSLGILESLALGHAAMGALLCANQLKGTDRLNVSLECTGPLKGFSVDATAGGQVRGYLKVETIPLESPLESFDLVPFIQDGHLSVSKTTGDVAQPFTGTIELQGRSIAQELTRYFLISEQIPTAISLSVYFDPEGIIRGAGGLFFQAMPGADVQVLEDLEDWLPQVPSLGKALSEKETPSSYLHQNFGAFTPEIIGSRGAEFFCSCSSERYKGYLGSLDETDLHSLRDHNPTHILVTCHNCNSVYPFSHDEIRRD